MSADRLLEREVATAFNEAAPSREPDRLYDSIVSATGRVRPRPRWLAILKEPPMRYRSHLASGSPTLRLTSVLALTLALILALGAAVVAGASLVPSPAPAGPPFTIVVDQSGDGDALTITDGVALAQDGDTVVLRPGTYPEHVVIDKDITLEGDPGSPRDAVVIEFTLDSPGVVSYYGVSLPNAITLDQTDATLRHLTMHGPNYGIGVQVSGGQPVIEDLAVTMSGDFTGKGRYALHVTHGAGGAVRDITCDCSVGINGRSTPAVSDLHLTEDVLILDGFGTDPVVTDSELVDVWIQDGAVPTMTGNTLHGSMSISGTGAPEIVDNTFVGPSVSEAFGVNIESAHPRLLDNTIRGQVTGIKIAAGAGALIDGNKITDNTTGILLDGTPANDLFIADNVFCGNATDLDAADGRELPAGANKVCAVTASSAP